MAFKLSVEEKGKKMALIKCKECGHEVSKSAKQCPNCGHDNRSWWDRRNIVSKVFIIFFGLIMLAGIFSGEENNGTDTSKTKPTTSSQLLPSSELKLPPKTIPYSKPKFASNLQDARSDYQWRLDLVGEQTTRLDMYYAVKSGEFMSCKEYKAWLDDLESQTKEFIKRNLDAIYSGENYQKLLNANVKNLDYDGYLREFNRIKKNNQIYESDIEIATNNFNSNVEKYNQECAT